MGSSYCMSDNFGGFVADCARRARYHFRNFGLRPNEITCAMPSYLQRALQFRLAIYTPPTSHYNPSIDAMEIKKLYDFNVVPGYENKLVFFHPDMFFVDYAKPIYFDIPEEIIKTIDP